MFSTLLINLDSSTNRLEFQTRQLNALNIDFERLKAVSVDDISQEEYENISNDWERKLKKTEVACFLSHYVAWQKVIEMDRPTLILEDDILLSRRTREVVENISKLNNFYHVSLEIRGRKKLLGKKKIPLSAECNLYRLYQDRSGAAAYILTPEGARILITDKEKYGIGLVDAMLCRCYALQSLQIVPAMAIQSDVSDYYGLTHSIEMPSTIGTEKKVNNKNISKKYRRIFKYRRIVAQLRIGWQWAKHFNKAQRKNIDIESKDFTINS